jgi:AAT family amino acid transporter
MGFVTAGMWWFYWVATVMSELAAIGKLLEFWFPALPAWVPGLVALILFTASNLLIVRVFGEVEYWFAVLKVLAVAVFMLFGLLMILTGAFNQGRVLGLSNLWTHGGFLPNGLLGILMAISLVVQAYSGIETLAVEAGESRQPDVTMRRAFRAVTLRILLLYVGSMFIMLCAFPWDYLIHHSGSPYVLLFSKIGIPLAAGLINLIVVLSGLSSCNTGLYGGSRILFSMAGRGEVSARVGGLNANRVPAFAVWVTALAISAGILITYLAPNNVYVWITSASAFASLWTWGVILFSELSFRRQADREGRELRYRMPLWPALPVAGIALLVLAFAAIVISPLTRVSVFSGLVFLAALWLYHLMRGSQTA